MRDVCLQILPKYAVPGYNWASQASSVGSYSINSTPGVGPVHALRLGFHQGYNGRQIVRRPACIDSVPWGPIRSSHSRVSAFLPRLSILRSRIAHDLYSQERVRCRGSARRTGDVSVCRNRRRRRAAVEPDGKGISSSVRLRA